MCALIRSFGGEMEAGGAVDAVGVEQRHRRHLEVLAHAYQFLGQGSAFEEAECGTGVKFDVHQVLSAQLSVLSKNSCFFLLGTDN